MKHIGHVIADLERKISRLEKKRESVAQQLKDARAAARELAELSELEPGSAG